MNSNDNFSKSKGRSAVFTANVLNIIYGLSSSNNVKYANGTEISLSEAKISGNKYYVGLCTEDNKSYILKDEEMLLIEILLNWAMLTNNTTHGCIRLSDIDYIRRRNKDNRQRVKENHKNYISILNKLKTIYFVCSETTKEACDNKHKHPLFTCKAGGDGQNYSQQIEYSFNELGKILEALNQVVVVEENIYDIRLNEMMNYKIMRYIIVSAYMNRIKKESFVRTHKSILNGIIYDDNDIVISYYDYYCGCEYISRYLNRYISRLRSVLEKLKSCNYIEDYSIERINTYQELMMSCGKVTIVTKRYKRKRKVLRSCPDNNKKT